MNVMPVSFPPEVIITRRAKSKVAVVNDQTVTVEAEAPEVATPVTDQNGIEVATIDVFAPVNVCDINAPFRSRPDILNVMPLSFPAEVT